MDRKMMSIVGVVCLIACAVCVFVAIERYNTNAKNVRAISALQQSSPLSEVMGVARIKPATPTATKYAALLAGISGVGGGVLLVMSRQKES